MSVILKALAKAQKKYADNAKAVLAKNAARTSENAQPAPAAAPDGNSGSKAMTQGVFHLDFIYLGLALVVAVFIGVTVLMNDRVTSRINLTNDQMADILAHLKSQEEKVAQLNDTIAKLETASDNQTQTMNTGFAKLNSDVSSKIGILKGDLNNQKSVWDHAISEQGKTAAKNRELIETYRNENQDLKDRIESLKEKIESIKAAVPTPTTQTSTSQ